MNTKIIVALALVGVLAVAVIGLVSAQIATPNPDQNRTTPYEESNGGFFGWLGRCFGFGRQYYGTQAPTYQEPLQANITVTDPNTGQTATYQRYYGYGYGGCMRGFFP